MTYFVNNEKVTEYEFQEALFQAINYTCKESFDEYLDDVHEPIKIMGIVYDVSYVLHEVDPIAYDMVMNEYFDNIYQEDMYDMKCGNEIERYNKTFKIE